MKKTATHNKSPLSYRFLLWVFTPVILFITIKKALSGGGLHYIQQRFAFSLSKINKQAVWFHGASVGEINALLPLVIAYKKKHPSQTLLVSCNTSTALQILKKHSDDFQHCYLPLDYSNTSKRFVITLAPKQLIVMETELWPNLYSHCSNAGCSITLVNGRLSDKTLNSNKLMQNAYQFCMSQIHYIFARTEQDLQGFKQLGIDETKIKTLGNIKYQMPLLKNNSNVIPRPFILLASSHHDEESQIGKIWLKHPLAKTHLLVIAPRHPERGNAIEKQLSHLSLNVAVRSKKQNINKHTQVYIADTIGEMATWYQYASLVIMAGSFIQHGGQNFIEPASYGKAIITGPFTHNFKQDVATFLQHKAILQVDTIEQLSEQLSLFSSTPCLFDNMAKNAKLMLNDTIVATYLDELTNIS